MNNTDLIWRNLSDFWKNLPEEDRNFIEVLWNGWAQCLDAEYAQLYNIDTAKTLETCPIFSKYRWCLLDLTPKNLAKIKDAIKSAKSSNTNLKASVINSSLSDTNHVDHRHFYIRPYNFHQIIKLPFNLEPALVEGFKLYIGGSSNGTDLYYGPDYLTNGNNLVLGSTISTDSEVAFYIGINETGLTVNNSWFRYSTTVTSPTRTFVLPNSYDSDIGIMVFVNGKYIDQTELVFELSSTISITFPVTGLVEFIWYVKDPLAKFNQFHKHYKQLFIFNPDANSGTGVAGSVSYLPLNPPQGLSSNIRYSGPESKIRVFLRGNFYPEENWTYNPSNGTINFNNSIIWNASEFVPIAVEFVEIQDMEFDANHIHVIREYSNVTVTTVVSTFDDGGRFDDNGTFDTIEDQNNFVLEFEVADVNTLRIYFNNRYLYYQYDYILYNDKKTLSFKFPIKNGNFRFEYERSSGRFLYGSSDLDGLTPAQIRDINLLLFYNEDVELMAEFNVNSPEEDTKAIDAYNVASQDIYCVSIPRLQNKVDNPDIIFNEKTLANKGDYKIIYGGIESDVTLSEYLWCPVVYFDESFLAKNFGVFVDYLQIDSSLAYKQALIAIWSGLWNGPICQNIEWIVSMFMNIPFFPSSGTIISIEKQLQYTEILTESDTYYLDPSIDTTLKINDNVYLGQSLTSASKYVDNISYESQGLNGDTTLTVIGIDKLTKPGDILSITNGSATGVYKIIKTDQDKIILNKPLSGPVGLIQSDTFDSTVVYDSIENSIKWNTFSNAIEIGSYLYFLDVFVPIKVIDKNNGRLILEGTPPTTITSGLAFYAYNINTIAIVDTKTYPFVKRNGIIRNVTKVYNSTITLNNGNSIQVPSNFTLDVAIGQQVERFQPVTKQVAVYDNEIRPDWYLEKNSAFSEENKTPGTDTVERILDSICDIEGSWIIEKNGNNLVELIKVGDQLRVSSSVNLTGISYEVILVRNDRLKIKNNLVNDTDISYYIDRNNIYIAPEDKPHQESISQSVTVTLSDSATSTSPTIRLVDASNLPDSGVIKVEIGGNIEYIKYNYKLNNDLRECTRLFNSNSGNISLSIPSGTTANLAFEFSSKILREVFYAGIRSISNIYDNNFISNNSKDLFTIIKDNTTIIELFTDIGLDSSNLNQITTFLNKLIPASSFWFMDINKALLDVDERDPEEKLYISKSHFNCTKYDDIADYDDTTFKLTINGTIGIIIDGITHLPQIRVNDWVYANSIYVQIVEINGSELTLASSLGSSQIGLPVKIISPVCSGTCETNVINSLYTLDSQIQLGCNLTILSGQNVGRYIITNVSDYKITISETFIETGNSLPYDFYITSNEGEIL